MPRASGPLLVVQSPEKSQGEYIVGLLTGLADETNESASRRYGVGTGPSVPCRRGQPTSWVGETLKGREKVKLSRNLALTLRVASMLALGAALVPMLATPAQAQDPPTATINTPAGGGTYYVGQSETTTFSCTEGTTRPGISSCNDNTGATNPFSAASDTMAFPATGRVPGTSTQAPTPRR